MGGGFPCSRCGACCRLIGRLIAHVRLYPQYSLKGASLLLASFPYDAPGGVCEKYDPAIGCTVYDKRPEVCNFDKTFVYAQQNFPGITKREHYKSIAEGCNKAMRELGIDPSFNINI